MSLLNNVLHWIANAHGLDGARQDAAKAIAQAGQRLLSETKTHAPDMVTLVEQQVVNAVTTAVTGALTRSNGHG